jgi:chromosome segregation ATPase
LPHPNIRNKGNTIMNAIENAGHQVALAESAANAAADELAAAHAHADNIRDRRAVLVSERDAIAAVRKAGGDADGARLALLAVDIEALDGLLVEATAAVAAAQTKADEARVAVTAARQQLDLATSRDLLARLAPHATALSAKLAETMAEIRAVEARLKLPRPSWAPPKAFANEIRRLDLQGDGVPGIRQ